MGLVRRYMWLWVIIGMFLGSLIIVTIFILINRCISRTGKHRVAHLQRRSVFNTQSNMYQETNLESSTPPLPPRTQFLMAEAQSYENLADAPAHGKNKTTHNIKQRVDDYEQPEEESVQPLDDYEEAQEEYEQPQEEYLQPLGDNEQPEEEYEQPQEEYEQPQEEYLQPLGDNEQPEEEYEQPQEEYLQPLDVDLQSQNINNPAPSMDSVSTEDYDDIGGEDEKEDEEDYDDVG